MSKWLQAKPAVPVVASLLVGMVVGLFTTLPPWMLLAGIVVCLVLTIVMINSPKRRQRHPHQRRQWHPHQWRQWHPHQWRLYFPQWRLYFPQWRAYFPQWRAYFPQWRLSLPQWRLYFPQWRALPPMMAFLFVGCLLMQRANSRMDISLTDEKVVFDAILLDIPQEKASGLACEFYVLDGFCKHHKLRLYIKNDSTSLNYFGKQLQPVLPQLGQTYRIRTKLRNENENVNGVSSYALWAKSKGYAAQGWVYPQNIRPTDARAILSELPFMERVGLKAKLLRESLLDRLFAIDKRGEQEAEYAVLAAMAFGDKSAVTSELRDTYSRTGASHLLALSGMHLGILYAILMFFFGGASSAAQYLSRWGFVRTFLKNVMILMLVWFYVLLTGMPSSVVRAATMLTIYTILSIDGRTRMSVNVLAVTAMLMLCVNPLMLWDIGFQMSFLAMLSIFVFQKPMHAMLIGSVNHLIYIIYRSRERRRGHWDPLPGYYLENIPLVSSVLGIVTVSVAAQILTAPLALFYFGRFSACFLVTNIIAIPLVTVLLYLVFGYVVVALVAGAVGVGVGTFMPKAIFAVAGWLNGSMEWLAGFDLCVEGVRMNVAQLGLVYVGIIIAYVIGSLTPTLSKGEGAREE